MATILETPISAISSLSAQTCRCASLYHSATKANMSEVMLHHLSSTTIQDLIVEPSINITSASASICQQSPQSSTMGSRRCSVASTTESSLRRSNHVLIEMLHNITTELSTHRSILLNIQHRVSHLEHQSTTYDPPLSAPRALEGYRSTYSSKLIQSEVLTWWEACQNFARNSENPLSPKEFLRTPRRFSGFDWNFGLAPVKDSHAPPATPPEITCVPPLTPPSEEDGDEVDVDTPRKQDIESDVDEILPSTPKRMDVEVSIKGNIKEHTVEVDMRNMPAAPVLLRPPPGKQVSINSQTVITSIQPAENPHRYYKGIRSLTTYKALMRNTKSEKEHYVLIHFHKRDTPKDLEDVS